MSLTEEFASSDELRLTGQRWELGVGSAAQHPAGRWSVRDAARQALPHEWAGFRHYRGKRVVDVTVASLVLLLGLPLLAVIAFAVAVSSPGPVFYRQVRVGLGGRTFPCLKFRTMVPDAEVRLAAMVAVCPRVAAEYAASAKLKNDPRTTRIGRVLRRSSLDELPQFINVLRGHMSVVGPRPIIEQELHRYGDHMSAYLSVRPGVTGAWQVSGRSETTYEDRVALDRKYIDNHNLRADLSIVFRTLWVVLKRSGAY